MNRPIFIALLLALIHAPAVASAPDDPFANILPPEWTAAQVQEILQIGPPPFTQEDVDRWLVEVRPVVERIAGRTFTKPPVARVVTREEFIDAMGDELMAQANHRTPNATTEQQVMMVFQTSMAAQSIAPLAWGLYLDTLDAILIPAEQYPGLMRLTGHESTSHEQVVKAVLAHELTHALQDQVLAGFDLPADQEQFLAYRAAVEGHAIHVQALVTDAMGLRDGHRALLTALAPARISEIDPATASQTREMRRASAITYRGGYRFMRHMADAGGVERLWEVLEAPPVTVREIENPELYATAPPWVWPGEAVVFRAIHERLDAADWRRSDVMFTPARGDLLFRELADAELRHAAIAAVAGGGMSTSQRTDGKALFMVSALRMHEPAHREVIVRAFDEMSQTKYENMRGKVELSELRRSDIEVAGCDGASLIEYTVTMPQGQSIDMAVLSAWRGKHFVLVSAGGDGPDDAAIGAVITSVLDAMDTGQAAPADSE